MRAPLRKIDIAAPATLVWILFAARLPIAAQVWLEPQIGPSAPIRIVFDTSKPFATVTENKGLVSLWDVSNPRHPIRVSSIPTDAQAASLRMDLGLIATGGRNGKISLWNLDGSLHGAASAGDQKPIYAVLFSPEARLLASGDADGTVRMWNLDGTPHGSVLKGHSAAVTSISSRGALWASGSLDGTVRLWNSDGNQTYPPLKTGGKGVYSVAFSPDGESLLAGGKDGLLCLWRLGKPNEVQFIHGHDNDVFSVAFNPKGDLFASASSDGSIRFWNNDGTAHGAPIRDYGEDFTSVSFSPSDDVLAAVTASNNVRIWSMQPTEYSVPLKGYSGYISPLAFSPNGRSIATVGKDGVARVSDLVGKRNALSLQGSRFPTSMVFAPTGDVVATAGEFYAKPGDKSSVTLWDGDGTKLREIVSSGATQIVALAFSRKGQFLVGLDLKGEVRLWDTTGNLLGEIPANGAGVISERGYPKGSIAISKDDTLLAFVGQNATAQLWRLAPDSHKLVRQVGTLPRVATLAISPTSDLLAAAAITDGGPRAMVQLHRLDGAVVRDFPVGQSEISSLTFTADGTLLVSADQLGTLAFSNLDGSAHFLPIRAHERFDPVVASSPLGNIIASTGMDGVVRLWDLDPSLYAQFPGFVEQTISAIAVSPQRDLIVAGTTEGGVLFLKPDGSSLMHSLTPHRGRVTAVTWSANGAVAATADAYGAIKLWHRDGTLLPDLNNPSGNGSSPIIALSPDGQYLAKSDVSLRICLIAARTCQELASGPPVHLAFSPAASQLTVTDTQGVVETMDTNGKRLQETRHLHGKMMFFEGKPLVAIGSRKRRVVFVDDQGSLHMFAGRTGREDILVTHRSVVMIGLSNDEDFLAAIDRSGGVQLWNLRNGALVGSRELGADLDQVGCVGSAIYVLDTHNSLSLLDHDLHILARLTLGISNSMAVSQQWFTVSGEVNDGVKGFRGRAEQLSAAELSRYISPEYFYALVSGPSVFQRFLLASAVLFRDSKQWYASSLSREQKSGFWLMLLFLVTMAWWAIRPATFVRWAMESVAETNPPSWKVAVNWLNFARGLGMTHHSRSAWLETQKDRLWDDLFDKKASVQRRKAYADLQNKSVIEAWRQAIRDGKSFHVWIQGPGGYGKSALAFRLARLSSESGVIIPVLIEEDWGTDIYRYLGSRLEYSKRRPTKGLLQRFIGDGQLCVLIDGLSERRIPDVIDQIEAFERDSGARFIVVTSRDAPRNAGSWFNAKVGPVDPDEIGSFLEAYVPEEKINDVNKQLTAFVNRKPASQLLLRLAVEHLLQGAMLPRTYAELVQDYVLGLRPGRVLSEVEFMRLARVSAECCVLATLTPRQVTSEYIVGYFAKEALVQPFLDISGSPRLAPIVLDDLIKSGLMFRLLVQGTGYVGFSEDPVSEYLAAMHVVGRGARSTADLRRRLDAANGTAAGLRKALGDVLDWRQPSATSDDPEKSGIPRSVDDVGASPT